MAFYWRHQVDNVASPVVDSPSELLNYNDVYYEDHALRVKPPDNAGYVGLVQTVGIRRCQGVAAFVVRMSVVAANPDEGDGMDVEQREKLGPEIGVEGG